MSMVFDEFVCLQTDQVQQATDATAIAADDDRTEQRINRDDDETPLNDHLFNAILASTPDTKFIVGEGAGLETDIEEVQPQRKPLIVRTLHPKMDRDGNPYQVPPTYDLEEEEETEPVVQLREDDIGRQSIATVDSGSLTGSFMYERSESEDGSTVMSNSSLDYDALISKQLESSHFQNLRTEMAKLNNPSVLENQNIWEEEKEATASEVFNIVKGHLT